MAVILSAGSTESKIFKPRAKFGITLRAVSGEITGDWFLYHSSNKDAPNSEWTKSHKTPFSDGDPTGRFEVPNGFYCKLFGGEGSNITAEIDYLPVANPMGISIESDLGD